MALQNKSLVQNLQTKRLFAFIQVTKPQPPNSLGFQDAANIEKM